MSWRKTLMMPLVRSSIQRKIRAVITTDAAQGAIRAHRTIRRPGKCWLNSCAMASDTIIVTATTTTTQIAVRTNTPARAGSLNSSLKFSQPAEPRLKPSGLMCWNEVRNITTTGHTTTTAMRATAGPSHNSGASTAGRRRRRRRGGAGGEPDSCRVAVALCSDTARSVRVRSAALLGRLLDGVENALRVARDNGSDGVLDLRLDLRPGCVAR